MKYNKLKYDIKMEKSSKLSGPKYGELINKLLSKKRNK